MLDLKSPVRVHYEITNSCNLQCIFCQPRKNQSSRSELDKEKVFKVVENLSKAEVFSIFITGGEPLLRSDLPEILEKIYKEGISVELVTNGTLATGKLSKRLYKAGLRGIQVSLQGPENIHDSITNVKGSYKKTLKGIKNLRKAGIEVFLATVVQKKNYKYIPEMLEKLGKNKIIKNFRTLRFVPFSKDALDLIVEPKEIAKINRRIRKIASKYNLKIWDLYSGLSQKNINTTQGFRDMCQAGKIRMDILSDGTVVPCESLKNKDFSVGNILEKEVDELWGHKNMENFRKMNPSQYEGNCKKCPKREHCNSCRAIAYNLTGNIFGEDVSCWDNLQKVN